MRSFFVQKISAAYGKISVLQMYIEKQAAMNRQEKGMNQEEGCRNDRYKSKKEILMR